MGSAYRCTPLSVILEFWIHSSAWFLRKSRKYGEIFEFERSFWMSRLLYLAVLLRLRKTCSRSSNFYVLLKAYMNAKKPLKKFLGKFLVFLLPLSICFWKMHNFRSLLKGFWYSLRDDSSSDSLLFSEDEIEASISSEEAYFPGE